MAKPSDIVQLLLNDEQLASLDRSGGLDAATKSSNKGKQVDRSNGNGDAVGDLWIEEGDEFFGSAAPNAERGDEENGATGAATSQKKSRKSNTTAASRGRKNKKKADEVSVTPSM